jgi:CO/xanthine dehydrogenase FAD-binding subunit
VGSLYISGGTDLLVRIKSNQLSPQALISLRSIKSLVGIDKTSAGWRIGALTPVAMIAEHQGLQEHYSLLTAAAAALGSSQIRNRATIGGNLANASPCADLAPPLTVLNAQLGIAGSKGRKEIPLRGFFCGPGDSLLNDCDILTDIFLESPPHSALGWFKKRRRVHVDLALVSVALWAEMDADVVSKISIAAGAVAPIPLPLSNTAAVLEGKKLTPELIEEARAIAEGEVKPITDVRASAEYRRHIIGVYVQRGLSWLLGEVS